MSALASSPKSWTSSFKPSTPPRAVEWASDCPSAVPSSKNMVVVCGVNRMTVMVQRSLVSVVDDDESVRESLPDLLRQFGFAVQAFSSAEEFLASDCVGQTGCLILDIAMPGMTGPDLQRELTLRRKEIPIVFITAHRDETVRPRLLEQ